MIPCGSRGNGEKICKKNIYGGYGGGCGSFSDATQSHLKVVFLFSVVSSVGT